MTTLPLSRTSTLQTDKAAFTALVAKLGALNDSDFTNPRDGNIGINTAVGQPEFRSGGVWLKVPVHAGYFTPIVANGGLNPNRQNVCDATAANLAMTLPAGQPVGTWIQVEKKDTTSHTVSITGNIRAVGATTVTLSLQNQSVMFVVDANGSWAPFAGHTTLSSLDSRYAAIGAGGSLPSGTANGVTAQLLLHGTSAAASLGGYVFKRDDASFGVGSAYASAQAFEVLSPSTQLGSDQTGDYSAMAGPGNNPALYRVDRFGGVGTVQGMHFAPGLRDTAGGGVPIGIWIQLGAGPYDVTGVLINMPPAASAMVSPAMAVYNSTGSKKLFAVDATGAPVVYDDSNAPAAAMYPGTAGLLGARAIFNSKNTGVIPLWLNGNVGQTAPLLETSVQAITKSQIDATGAFVTYATNGTTPAGGLYTGDGGGAGYRMILNTIAAGTGGLAIRRAASQLGPFVAFLKEDGVTPLSGIDGAGNLITWNDAGSTSLAGVYAGTTPSSGHRAIFVAGAATISPLGIKAAAGQIAPLLPLYASDGVTKLGYFDAAANLFLPVDPTAPLMAATKQYVDAVKNGTLGSLSDIAVGTPANGQSLLFNTATNKWTPGTPAVSGTELAYAENVTGTPTAISSAGSGASGTPVDIIGCTISVGAHAGPVWIEGQVGPQQAAGNTAAGLVIMYIIETTGGGSTLVCAASTRLPALSGAAMPAIRGKFRLPTVASTRTFKVQALSVSVAGGGATAANILNLTYGASYLTAIAA